MADPSNLFYPIGPGSNSVQQFGPNPGLLSYLIASGAPQASQGQGVLGAPAPQQMMAPQAQMPSFSPWQQQGTAQHPWFPQIPPQSAMLQPGQRGYWASTQQPTNGWGGVGMLGNMGGQQGGDTPGMGTPGVGRGIAAPGMTFGDALMSGAFPLGAMIGALTQGNVPMPNAIGALRFLGSRMFGGGGGMGAPQGGLGANGPQAGNGGQANNAGY